MQGKFKEEGPGKHSAKQKAFVTVLAWAGLSVTPAQKSPMHQWGAFLGLGEKRMEGERLGGGLLFTEPADMH